jgi:short-subunit dehydrogenase
MYADRMSLPQPQADTTVIVTGASSGIGEELARELARRGYNTTLVARRMERLEQLANELRSAHRTDADVIRCDLSLHDERAGLQAKIEAIGKTVVGLCNNAGFGSYGRFDRLPLARETEMVHVNIEALLELCGIFLPGLVSRGEGAILNVASTAGCQPLPGMATYSATKAFVIHFSEAIWTELVNTDVSCTALCPGFVHTEFAQVAHTERLAASSPRVAFLSAKKVANAGVEGMLAGKRIVFPGLPNQIMALFGHHTPRTILLPFLRRYAFNGKMPQ